jgi:hypothetical protein
VRNHAYRAPAERLLRGPWGQRNISRAQLFTETLASSFVSILPYRCVPACSLSPIIINNSQVHHHHHHITSRTGSPSPCPAATAEPPSGTHRKLASRFSRTPLHQETGSQQPSRTKDLLLHTSSQPRVFLITTGIASTKIKHASCGEARLWT